jgi:predicted dienelactone hydrolase
MAWLGVVLAAHGYVAVAVNHPENSGMDGYSARGFSTWWERARDLSTVTDSILEDTQFRDRIDSTRIATGTGDC